MKLFITFCFCIHFFQNHTGQHRLKCRYVRHHPILYLQPAKEETVHHNPDIFLYHDVLSDKEMDTIKSLATPKVSTFQICIVFKV